eukprot:GEMP01096189.1.p1 GENE.GEMP01096189.1~~GEMP01096189.1.p1  ORF type:complete len:147 (+),score=40.98 GEMP01096189.1:31-441(+)
MDCETENLKKSAVLRVIDSAREHLTKYESFVDATAPDESQFSLLRDIERRCAAFLVDSAPLPRALEVSAELEERAEKQERDLKRAQDTQVEMENEVYQLKMRMGELQQENDHLRLLAMRLQEGTSGKFAKGQMPAA